MLLSCSNEPWYFEKYGPVDGKPNYRFKDDDGVSGLSVNINSHYEGMSHSGAPFHLHIKYSDHKMIWEFLSIKELTVSTSSKRILFTEEFTTLNFTEPGFVDGTQPYFRRAELHSKDLDLDHDSPERIIIRFEYSLHNLDQERKFKRIELEFEPYIDKGTFKPSI